MQRYLCYNITCPGTLERPSISWATPSEGVLPHPRSCPTAFRSVRRRSIHLTKRPPEVLLAMPKSHNPFRVLPRDVLERVKDFKATALDSLRVIDRDPKRRCTREHHDAYVRARQEEAEELGLF